MIVDVHNHLFEKEHHGAIMPWSKPLLIAGFWRGVGDGITKFRPIKNIDKNLEEVEKILGKYDDVVSADDLINNMDDAGIDYTAITGLNLQRYWNVYIPNDWIVEQVSKYPERLLGFISIDPLGGEKSVKELKYYIQKKKMTGLKLATSYEDIDPADPKIDPIYEACVELDIVVQNHTGWSLGGSLKYEDPSMFDPIGKKFPDLKYQLVHSGYHNYYAAIMLMLKHPNFWADLAWWYTFPLSELVKCIKLSKHYGVIDKLMWASDTTPAKPEINRLKSIPEISKELNLSPGLPEINNKDIEMILGTNAQRLYNLRKIKINHNPNIASRSISKYLS